jgi:hypothetical protein
LPLPPDLKAQRPPWSDIQWSFLLQHEVYTVVLTCAVHKAKLIDHHQRSVRGQTHRLGPMYLAIEKPHRVLGQQTIGSESTCEVGWGRWESIEGRRI